MKKVLSEETKQKISASNKGRTLSEEHKTKIGLSNTGKVKTQEAKQKISDALSGKELTEKQKEHLNNINKNRSEETKEKARKASIEANASKKVILFNHPTFGNRTCTKHELLTEFKDLDTNNIGKMINNKGVKSVKGWTVVQIISDE